MPLLINLADMDVAVLLDKDCEAERRSMYLTAKRDQVPVLHACLNTPSAVENLKSLHSSNSQVESGRNVHPLRRRSTNQSV